MSVDKVLRLCVDKLQVWTLDEKFRIMLLDLFRNSLQTVAVAEFDYKRVRRLTHF